MAWALAVALALLLCAGAAEAQSLDEGLTYFRADEAGQGGGRPPRPGWFVSFGIARNGREAAGAKACAGEAGLAPVALEFRFPDGRGKTHAEIVGGAFASKAEGAAWLAAHKLAVSCRAEVRALALYSSDATLPRLVHVLRIDPARFRGSLVVAPGPSGATGVARPSDRMRTERALAATNGGFFVMHPQDGVVGDPTGLSVVNGRLLSEATRGRPWVEIRNEPTLQLIFHERQPANGPALLTAGRRIALDGVNRRPGLLRNCGALRGRAHAVPRHDMTCRPDNEIVAILPGAPAAVPLPAGQEGWVLTEGAALRPLTGRGGMPAVATLLIATGERRRELRRLAAQAYAVRLDPGFRNVLVKPGQSAVNGGPALLLRGRRAQMADGQGWPLRSAPIDEATAFHRFVSLRAPRTAIGRTAAGHVLLVVVDGWRYRSDRPPPVPMNGGATIGELADILLRLGAVDALNLDGGGSSVMAVAGRVVSHPSDDTGERPVGDSLLLMPAQSTAHQ